MNRVTIYHNPRCSKSRQALALLQEQGVPLEIVEYLKTPPTVAQLQELLGKLQVSARDILRTGEEPYASLGLADPAVTETELLAAIAQNPILLQRPIVVRGARAVIARPPEKLRELGL